MSAADTIYIEKKHIHGHNITYFCTRYFQELWGWGRSMEWTWMWCLMGPLVFLFNFLKYDSMYCLYIKSQFLKTLSVASFGTPNLARLHPSSTLQQQRQTPDPILQKVQPWLHGTKVQCRSPQKEREAIA